MQFCGKVPGSNVHSQFNNNNYSHRIMVIIFIMIITGRGLTESFSQQSITIIITVTIIIAK